jgi:cytosine deaminase
MLDLLIKNANLPDGRTGVDIAIQDGRIAEVAAHIAAAARETIDAAGQLISPPFVDAHFHMDDALLQPAR